MNKIEAAALIHDHCNCTMQNQLLESMDFDENVKKDPVKMSEEIWKKMCDPSENKCRHHAATNVFKRSFEVEQDHGESVMDHLKRFEETRDTFKGSIGKEAAHEFFYQHNGMCKDEHH